MQLKQTYQWITGLTLVAALVALTSFSGCGNGGPIDPPKPPDVAEITLSFDLENGSEELAFQAPFTDVMGYQHRLLTLKFYLSNLVLVKADGSTEEVDEVVLFDYKPIDPSLNNPQWTREVSFTLPSGDYTGIQFGVGIPADINDEDPTTYANEDPLSAFSNMYWNWATMYRFIILEAESDTGTGSFDHDILIHTGLDDLYRTSPVYPISLSLASGDQAALTLSLDWNDIWYAEGASILLKEEHITHTTDTQEDFDLASRFTDNFVAGLKINQE